MGHMIVVEGPRGSGKTTLVAQLVPALQAAGVNAIARKESRTAVPPTHAMLELIDMVLETPDTLFVFDRFHLTELVMSFMLHRRPIRDLVGETVMIDSALDALAAHRVLLLANPEILDQRVQQRADGRGHDISPSAGYMAYCQAATRTSPRTEWLWNETPSDADHIIQYLVQTVKESPNEDRDPHLRAVSFREANRPDGAFYVSALAHSRVFKSRA